MKILLLLIALSSQLYADERKIDICTQDEDCMIKKVSLCCADIINMIDQCLHKEFIPKLEIDCSENKLCAKIMQVKTCTCIKEKCIGGY